MKNSGKKHDLGWWMALIGIFLLNFGVLMMILGLYFGLIWLFITGMVVEIVSWVISAAFGGD
jgi:hypothetical protein